MKHPKDLVFEPPGPGVWNTDGLHTPKPITRMKQDTYFVLPRGMRAGMLRYGALSEGISIAILHRFVYASPQFVVKRPPGADDRAKAAFMAEAAANPMIQERFDRADQALTTKRWRTDREHWDTIGKPWMMGRTLALTDENPIEMSDEALNLHIQESIHHLALASEYHHILNLVPALPRCLLFLDTAKWTGLSIDQLEPLLLGSSPISAGNEPEMRTLCDALDANPAAVAELTSGDDPAGIVDAFTSRTDDVGAAFRDFVRMVGYRTLDGWEPMNPYILETPNLLIEKITHGLKREYPEADPKAIDEIRARVPDSNLAAFNELLEDARTNSRVKDERDLYCNMPICGVLRRGVIEAGRRVADRGLISEVEHMTEASIDEVNQLLISGRSDLAEELADRHAYRMAYSIDDVPAMLGDMSEMPQPVDPSWLPAHSGRLLSAMGINMMLNTPLNDADTGSETILKGKPVSPGVYEGVARVVKEPGEINDIKQGEVLVTRATNPAFNIILPRLGALVTQYGGVLSHAAIVSREFGLPGIVGCKEVTKKVKTGDRVTVNGDNGEITIHGS